MKSQNGGCCVFAARCVRCTASVVCGRVDRNPAARSILAPTSRTTSRISPRIGVLPAQECERPAKRTNIHQEAISLFHCGASLLQQSKSLRCCSITESRSTADNVAQLYKVLAGACKPDSGILSTERLPMASNTGAFMCTVLAVFHTVLAGFWASDPPISPCTASPMHPPSCCQALLNF